MFILAYLYPMNKYAGRKEAFIKDSASFPCSDEEFRDCNKYAFESRKGFSAEQSQANTNTPNQGKTDILKSSIQRLSCLVSTSERFLCIT